jgi:predicted DNA-binding transcriptional regulator YafY
MDFFKMMDRLSLIHRLISKEITGTPDKFAERLNLSRRQFYNVLAELKDDGIIIKYSRIRQTFYYTGDSKTTISDLYAFEFEEF